MSRIGYKVIKVPAGVTITKDGDNITVKGPKGELTRHFAPEIEMHQEGDEINFTRPDDSYKAVHGTMRANLNNMVVGVTEGYKKEMKLVGVGYRAQKQGEKLVLNVGYSHPVEMTAPKGVTVEVPSTTAGSRNRLLASLQPLFVPSVHLNLIRVRGFVTLTNMSVVRKVRLVSSLNLQQI